ncbi:DUF4240 domain-containing protein [Actinomadura scrupuli]|uniref:DUF4240 domain-containing protein n=1 Tax=Actinomadura scrupuli TaxID=559629 RepID=UPI003D963E5F
MDVDTWWGLIERARAQVGERADDRDSPDDPLVNALTELLVALEPEQIIAFKRRFGEVSGSAYRYPLWTAAELIEGGCGDDGFMDFRAGLILQGRTTFEWAVADPDSLAGLPVVIRMAGDEGGWIGCEAMNYAPRNAYARKLGETGSFDAALSGPRPPRQPSGEHWTSEERTRERLPRLSALFL